MSVENIRSNIESYKRKLYLRDIIKGLLLTLLISSSLLLFFNYLENTFWFDSTVRFLLFSILLIVFFASLTAGVINPLLSLINLKRKISDEKAANEIGKYFPEISDKLINYLQISQLSRKETSLIAASILQKTDELKLFRFSNAIDLRINNKYLYALLGVIGFAFLISFINPPILTESTRRIVLYNTEFKRAAPFEFVILNKDLDAFQNENFELKIQMTGKSLPENVFLQLESRKLKLSPASNYTFTHTFSNVQRDIPFTIEAAGFQSDAYRIRVLERPELRDFTINLDYPDYTGLKNKQVKNTGNLAVQQGTVITWSLNTSQTDQLSIVISDGNQDQSQAKSYAFRQVEDQLFTYEKQALQSFEYELKLKNRHSFNGSKIAYFVEIIPDEEPLIETVFTPDTIFYSSIAFSGNIADDYGISSLQLKYKLSSEEKFRSIAIPFDRTKINQKYFLEWRLDTLELRENEGIELFVSVKDNDRINGPKESRSKVFYFKKPDRQAIEKMLDEKSEKSESQLEKTRKESEALNQKVEELEERLKNKNKIEWQEEKLLRELLKEKENIDKSIEKLKQEHEQLLNSEDQFRKQNERLREKKEQLHKLMNEILDEETKKLYEELQKLLEENASSEEVLNQLQKIKPDAKNLEKELERALELFKRLKLETSLGETSKKLEELGNRQEKLAEQNEGKKSGDKLQQQQDEIQKEFEQIQKEMDEIEKMNQELKNPEPLQDFSQEEQEIRENLEEISEDLQNNNNSRQTKQKQQSSGKKMKKMSQKMSQMMAGMEMTMMQENIDNLRDILDNLVKLSFQEEQLIENFKSVQQVDPRFIELSQEQLQIMSNSKVVEDSLLSLASRVVQISNFVTREIDQINRNLDGAMESLRERNKGKAASQQQFAMTSMNNLALLLDDVLQQMQMAMAEAMGKPQKGGNKNQSLPSLSELQKQLSEQIQQLKKSGKTGRELSEQLAKLAAEQAMLRQQLKEIQKKLEGQPEGEGVGQNLKKVIEDMEKNEIDLVNKRLTETLIKRQQAIITRMLESEKSLREQKLDPEREGETAGEYERKLPPAYEEYLKAKQSEIELLKTIPLELNPFYKKEVNDYFRRLSGDN